MHERFVDRLAKIYIKILTSKGNEAARSWAKKFLGGEDLRDVAKEVIIQLKKRGYRIPEDPA